MPPDPPQERGLAAHLVVTDAYYTFSGRLQLKLLKLLDNDYKKKKYFYV